MFQKTKEETSFHKLHVVSLWFLQITWHAPTFLRKNLTFPHKIQKKFFFLTIVLPWNLTIGIPYPNTQ